MSATLASRVLAVLPQTQCRRCTYADCAAYAQAIAQGDAAINQCPPGGALGVQRLAALTGQGVLSLNPACGAEGARKLAFIDEAGCIGCTLCIKACPTSAIVGSNKLMHTVMEIYCTGCELCLPVCPVDCIVLENASANATGWAAWSSRRAHQARVRYEQTQQRRQRREGVIGKELREETPVQGNPQEPLAATADPTSSKRATIAAALMRARLKRVAGEDAAGTSSPQRPRGSPLRSAP